MADAPQDISFDEMVRRQHALLDVVGTRPGRGELRHRPRRQPADQQRLRDPRSQAARRAQVPAPIRSSTACARSSPRCRARRCSCRPRRTSTSAAAPRRTQYQYTLQDSNIDELNDWAPKLLAKLQKLPQLRDVASDQQTASGMLSLTIDRDQAARFGIQPAAIDQALYDAFGQRQVAQYFTQVNSYHVILEVTPSLQTRPASLQKIYVKSPLTGQMVPLSAMTRYDTQHVTYLSINHQGQFPAVTLSFNLAPGVALGDAVDAITGRRPRCICRPPSSGTFQGTAQAFQSSLEDPALPDPGGAGGGLHHSRHAVRELHPSADHSVHAAVGRRRRAAGAAAVPLRSVGDRA